MRIWVTILSAYFFILSLAPNLQGAQIFRLSALIQHYIEHQKSNDDFDSFISFIQEHYSAKHKTSGSEENLPFKSTIVTVTLLVFQPFHIDQPQLMNAFAQRQKMVFKEPIASIKNRNGSVWNPPQYV
jgi:hypothetical protein